MRDTLSSLLADSAVCTELLAKLEIDQDRDMRKLRTPSRGAQEQGDGLVRSIAISALKKAGEDVDAAAALLEGQEAIVRAFARPVLLVRRDSFEDPDSNIWRERLGRARKRLVDALPAIGRLDVMNHGTLSWVGTAWRVAAEVLVTNRHVASLFALGVPPFEIRLGPNGKTVRCLLDTYGENSNPKARHFLVSKVLWMAPDDNMSPDVAFLQVKATGLDGEEMGPPIELGETEYTPDQDIAVVGYPGWDGDRNNLKVMMNVFGGVFDVKRVSPGKVIYASNWWFAHDCTTLGGSSGSVVFGLEDGRAVGLHFGGRYGLENYAVSSCVVLELLHKHVRV